MGPAWLQTAQPPCLLTGEQAPLTAVDGHFAPVHAFAEAYRRRKAAVAHHVLDGAFRNAEGRAEGVLGQERRERLVWHEGFQIGFQNPVWAPRAQRREFMDAGGACGPGVPWQRRLLRVLIVEKNQGSDKLLATGFSETFLKLLLGNRCV